MTARYPEYDGTQPCRDNPEVFFPDQENARYAMRTAKIICGMCPFLEACRDFATDHDVRGTWGATSFPDRALSRAQRGVKAIPITLNDVQFRQQLIAEFDDGNRNAEEIAEAVGCSEKTVERYLTAKHRGEPQSEVA